MHIVPGKKLQVIQIVNRNELNLQEENQDFFKGININIEREGERICMSWFMRFY